MSKTKSNEIRAKSIQYFMDGGISSGHIACFSVFVYGKAKIIVGYLNLNDLQIEEAKLLDYQMQVSLIAQKQNIPYYVLSDSINYYWFNSNTNEPLGSALSFEDFKKEIPQIHEELFQFLE